ncbi:acyl-coenzyme A thioesterase 1-like isoform X2 [Babylonia areolata]|uniref:acyl-coenzyme A thioesterase 1-like isoform X2 n=1 Tax=Babylonia areolata TaxID=304850 RepID=UPI003FD693D3
MDPDFPAKGLSSAASRLRQLHPVLWPCTLQQPPNDGLLFSTETDHIQVTPRVSLFDQKVEVRVHGLPSKAKVTLHVRTHQEWRRKLAVFRSCGHFVAGDNGDLDLSRDASVGGTYTGVDPMGLFWSLAPCPSGPQNIRMVLRNGDDPVLYTLSLHPGHCSLSDLVAMETTQKALHTTMVTRLKKAADVRRIPVREGGVRGVLFLPPGDGPHPGVIDMFGSAGGLIETRAALLASHGFAVLALPFCRFDDLPDMLEDIRFDYFEEAVSWFSCHRVVRKGGIGVVAVSAGGTISLALGWKCPQVKAVVCINGPVFCYGDSFLCKDGTVLAEGVKVDRKAVRQTNHGHSIRNAFPYTTDDIIPVWESEAHYLMLVSDDDHQVDPASVDTCHAMFPDHKHHLMEVVHYPGAGHLLEPPYTPHCLSCVNPNAGIEMRWGGNPADHADAQVDSWERLQTFLHTHLS